MSTKKTVDTEIVEDVEKIEPEVIEEVKAPVVDEVKEIVPEVKAPLRGISTPSMIHTHLDNFLAKLCGETPIDANVRNSLEYWINELAEGHGGSTKPIYFHLVFFTRNGPGLAFFQGNMVILNNDPTPITISMFLDILRTPGFRGLVYNGVYNGEPGTSTPYNAPDQLLTIKRQDENNYAVTIRKADKTIEDINNFLLNASSFTNFIEIANNRIN